jgi:hypothetical protein
MKLAMTGFHDLAMWVEEDPNTPLAIIPKAMEPTAHDFAERVEKLKAEREDYLIKYDNATDDIKRIVREAAEQFVKDKGWEECPHAETEDFKGCECPAYTLINEYNRDFFDGCSACPFGGCC